MYFYVSLDKFRDNLCTLGHLYQISPITETFQTFQSIFFCPSSQPFQFRLPHIFLAPSPIFLSSKCFSTLKAQSCILSKSSKGWVAACQTCRSFTSNASKVFKTCKFQAQHPQGWSMLEFSIRLNKEFNKFWKTILVVLIKEGHLCGEKWIHIDFIISKGTFSPNSFNFIHLDTLGFSDEWGSPGHLGR